MPQGGPSIPRDALQRVRPGDRIDHRAFNALVDFVRSQGAPPGRHQFEDAGQVMTRGESGRVARSGNWARCESDDASVPAFSLLEIYDGRFDDDGMVFSVRKPEDGAQLFGGNEDFAIAGSQGWVKLVTPYEPVIARCSEDVAFLDDLSPDDDYGVESGSDFTAMTSRDARDRVMLLGKVGGGGGGGGNWIVEIVEVDTECDCVRATCEVIRRPEGDSRWKCGDEITVYDDLGCVLNTVASDLTGVRAVICRTVGDCEYSDEMLPEECDPYGEVDLKAAHFSFVRRCCTGDLV
jgi:hypothetical protein